MADPLIEALGGAAIYAVVFYAKNRVKKGHEFDPIKLVSTLLVGLVVGVITVEAGLPITGETVFAGLAANAGLVATVDATLSAALDGRLGDECFNGKKNRTTDDRTDGGPTTETGLDRIRTDGGFVWGDPDDREQKR